MTNVLPNVTRLLADADKESADVLRHAESKRDAEPDDFSFWAVQLCVGEHSASGVDDGEYFVVDMATGILIIEAARKIISDRRAALASQRGTGEITKQQFDDINRRST